MSAPGAGPTIKLLEAQSVVDGVERRALRERHRELERALATAQRDGRERSASMRQEMAEMRRQLALARQAIRALRLHPMVHGGVLVTPGADGETWVLDVATPDAGLLRLSAVEDLPAGWQRIPSEHAENGTALVGQAGSPGIQLGGGSSAVWLRLLRHPWSGSTEMSVSALREVVDLRDELTTTTELLCSAEAITLSG